MKKLSIIAACLLVLALCVPALADGSNGVEVVKVDGISVIMFTPKLALAGERDGEEATFALPPYLARIEAESFAGISAKVVEVSENVVSIGAKAFADCLSLEKIVIPATVTEIDDTALSGCGAVVVYGATGSEAERFAVDNGFEFVDPSIVSEVPEVRSSPAVELPFVRVN